MAGGKGKAGNPRDPSGAVMRCHGCGSDTHLIARCPKKGKGGKKGYKGKGFLEDSTEDWESEDLVQQYEF